ncbi:MAG: VapE domain-containing protein [Lachnospiraceae bacterium]
MIESIEQHKKKLKHDGSLPIATGKSRHEKNWKNKNLPWSQILTKLEKPVTTAETYKDYMAMPKAKQDQIKDVGGFIGGSLKDGRRKAENVTQRQLIALDADFAPKGLIGDLEIEWGFGYAYYSTHKHSPDKARLRLLIPLDRPVTPDEYEAIARRIADDIGIDYFDDTTYQPSRLMYWPSVASDGEYLFDYYDEPWLSADEILDTYEDWTDVSYWPESSRARERRKKTADKQGDPCEKTGLIGAFCRTYNIEEAINTFLSDVYIQCAMPGRYTYAEGSTAAGLVLYDDKFAYSNHATDPAGGKLCNSFDLVRIHKFGNLDDDKAPDTDMNKLPSYKEMIGFIQKDEATRVQIAQERKEQAQEDFDVVDVNWTAKLEINQYGAIKNSLNNILLIMEHDEGLKNIVFNEMSDGLEIIGDVPWNHPGKFWRDADDAQLESYLSKVYTEFPKVKIMTGITKAADDRSYHPVKEFLDRLPEWDGVERVDRLLIDYLGAEDNSYVRAVIRKTLCAAVCRVQRPGCKFDTTLVLCGGQGIGKSTLARRLGGQWFSDSLSLADTRDKTAAEKLQGNWIIEIGELAGLRKTDVETLKGFLSRQDDKYRASYGRRVESHPRQNVFIGTTNAEDGYLRDNTGGRRFWPVKVFKGIKRPWDITESEVRQLWAEVLVYVAAGEKIYLSDEEEALAEKERREALESDSKEGVVLDYLERELPDNWYSLNIYERREYLYGDEFGAKTKEGENERQYVTNIEIWCECFGKAKGDFKNRDSYEISGILQKLGWEIAGERKYIDPYGRQRIYRKKSGTN